MSAAEDRRTDEEASPPPKITPAAFESLQPENPTRAALPYMKAAWRMPLGGGKRPVIDTAIHHWEIESKKEDRQAVTVHSAVVAGSTIAFRSYEGICAVDAASGKSLWHYTSGTSFLRAWTDFSQLAGDNGAANENNLNSLMAAYAGNSVLGTLSTDGRRVLRSRFARP